MRKPHVFVMFALLVVLVVAGPGVASAAGPAKVQVCHIPPGNPPNFHTITISENALGAHLGHGDLAGGCFENCETLCDDADACTIDACEPGTEVCAIDHPPVNCDDGNACTLDSCASASGCQSAPVVCDDGNACTVDACNPFDGQCSFAPIDCGPLGQCLPEIGECDFPCDGITCDPIDQCHEAGECVLPGECIEGSQKANGSLCDAGLADTTGDHCLAGVCLPTPACGSSSAGLIVNGQCIVEVVMSAGESGNSVCAAEGLVCDGVPVGNSGCTAFNPGATTSQDFNGWAQGVLCNDEQGLACSGRVNDCHVCPACGPNLKCRTQDPRFLSALYASCG